MSHKLSYEDMNHEWDDRKLPAEEHEEEEEEDELDAADRRLYIRMAIETTLAVGLIVAVTMIVLATNNGYKCCQPRDGLPPEFGPEQMAQVKNITSGDARAIVAFAGYVKFLRVRGSRAEANLTGLGRRRPAAPKPEDFLFLPLNLTSVRLGPLEPLNSGSVSHIQVMNLTTDCAILSFHLNFDGENSTLYVSSIDIESTGQHSGYVEPSVVGPTAIQVDQGASYVCPFRQEYPVRLLEPANHKKRMVSLVFNVLNFELNEEPRYELKAGLFSKPAHYCYSPDVSR